MSDGDADALVAFARLVAERTDGFDPAGITTPADAEPLVQDVFETDVSVATYADVADTARALLDRLEDPAREADERLRAARMLRAAAPHLHSSSLVGRLVALVHDDAVGPAVRGALDRMDERLDDDDLAALADGDRSEREAALWYAVTRKAGDERLVDLVFEVLAAADADRRAFAARWLWAFPDAAADRLPRLLALTDDPHPEVRAAALSGAARLVREGDGAGVTGTPRDAAGDVVEAVADALSDADRRVRQRAASVAVTRRLVRDDDLQAALSFETRWRLATGLSAATTDDEPLVADRAGNVAADAVRAAARSDPAAVPELLEHGWPADRPTSEAAREALADLAAADPAAVADRADVAVEALDAGTETPADARLLAAVAPRAPDAVAAAAADLAALLDVDDERRRVAARALAALEDERPGAVPVDHRTLVEATADVTGDRGRLDLDRLDALADVDPDHAASTLADACEAHDHDDNGYRPARAVERLGDAHPRVVCGAAGEVVALLDALEPRLLDRAASGIVTAADHDPAAFAPHARALAGHLAAFDPDARRAVARALAAVGDADPDALPSAVRTLAERPPAPGDPAWPFGAVAASDPDFAGQLLFEERAWRERLGDARTSDVAGLLVEAAAGEEVVARAAVDRLADSLGEDPPVDHLVVLADLAEADPGLAAEATGALVATLAARSRWYGALRNAEEALDAVADADPDRVRAAIEAEFGTPEAFLEQEARGRRRHRERVVEAAFGTDDDGEGDDGEGDDGEGDDGEGDDGDVEDTPAAGDDRGAWADAGVDPYGLSRDGSRLDDRYADAFGYVAGLLDGEAHPEDLPELRYVAPACYPSLFETVRDAVDREP